MPIAQEQCYWRPGRQREVSQFINKYNPMAKLLKKYSEPNLNTLKHSIDTRILAILKYLNDDSNFAHEHNNKHSQTTIEPEPYDVLASMNVKTSMHCQFQEPGQSGAREAVVEEQGEGSRQQTPVKVSVEICEVIERGSSSGGSESRLKIEQSSIKRTFGGPLCDSNNINLEKTTEPFFIDLRKQFKATGSRKPTSRTNSIGSKHEGRNKQNSHTPYRSHQKSAGRYMVLSGVKRLFDQAPHHEVHYKVLSPELLSSFVSEIEELSKKPRKQTHDNNARARLLKRIISMTVKSEQF